MAIEKNKDVKNIVDVPLNIDVDCVKVIQENKIVEESKTLDYVPIEGIKQMQEIKTPTYLKMAPVIRLKPTVFVGVSEPTPDFCESANKTKFSLNTNLLFLGGIGTLAVIGLIKAFKLDLNWPITHFSRKKKNNKILTLQAFCPFSINDFIILCKKNPYVELGTVGIVIGEELRPTKAIVDFSKPIKNLSCSLNYEKEIKNIKGEGLRLISN